MKTLFLALAMSVGACQSSSSVEDAATTTSTPTSTSTNNTAPTGPDVNQSRPWVLYQSPVIDMHAHNWTPMSKPSVSDEEHLRKTLLEYSQYKVVKAIVSGPDFAASKWAQQYPELFLAGNMVGARPLPGEDPTKTPTPTPSVAQLREAHANGNLHAIGEVGFYYSGLYADGEIARPYFELAQDLDIPMGYHLMNNKMNPNAPDPTNGNPSQFQRVLRDFPDLRLYLMHAGFPFLDETKALLAEFPNLHVEISWIAVDPQIVGKEFTNQFEPYLKALIDAGYGKRILYGSDTVLNEQIIGQSIKAVDAISWLTPEQKADIFYFNAARFLNLPDTKIAEHWGQR